MAGSSRSFFFFLQGYDMFFICAAGIVIVIWRSEFLRSLNVKNVIIWCPCCDGPCVPNNISHPKRHHLDKSLDLAIFTYRLMDEKNTICSCGSRCKFLGFCY
jgi:hypothetical protein